MAMANAFGSIPNREFRVISAGLTDVGRRRQNNEDSFACSNELGLYVVADGMGAHAAGEVASSTAVSVIVDFAFRCLAKGDAPWPADLDPTLEAYEKVLVGGILSANRCLCALSRESADYNGMGTTVAGIILNATNAYAVHVGDSRIYLFRDGTLRQLTSDHTWVNEQVKRQLLTPEEARGHRWRNVITRALGNTDDLQVDSTRVEMLPGDCFLLCSDGLTNMLHDAAIEQALAEAGADLEATGRQLVDMANEAGGDDNITLVLVRIEPREG